MPRTESERDSLIAKASLDSGEVPGAEPPTASGSPKLNRAQDGLISLSRSLAAVLDVPFFEASVEAQRGSKAWRSLTYRVEANKIGDMWYRQKVGWGIYLAFEYESLDAKAKVTSLPLVAASVELGMMKARIDMQIFGVEQTPAILRARPQARDFDIEAYVHFLNAVNAVREIVAQEKAAIIPELLPE